MTPSFAVRVTTTLVTPLVQDIKILIAATVTVTVITEAPALRLLLVDRGRITESIRILVSVDRMEEKCFQITTKRVRRSQPAVLAPSAACSMLAVQQQKRLCPVLNTYFEL